MRALSLAGLERKAWASVTSGSGGEILRAKRGRVGGNAGGATEIERERDGEGWADEQERAVQWLELKVCDSVCVCVCVCV